MPTGKSVVALLAFSCCLERAAAVQAVAANATRTYSQQERLEIGHGTDGTLKYRTKTKAGAIRALCFQGMGWHAETVYVGVIAGLAAIIRVMGLVPKATNEHELCFKTLFDSYSIVSTVSGGSWLLTRLAYTESFMKLTFLISVNTESANFLWEQFFMGPYFMLLDRLNQGDETAFKHYLTMDPASQLIDEMTQQKDPDLTLDISWYNYVYAQMRAISGLKDTVMAGDAALPWTVGLLWLINVCIPTSGANPSSSLFWSYSVVDPNNTGKHLRFQFRSDMPVMPGYLPAKFSIVMKDRVRRIDRMPFPFCGVQDCYGLESRWEAGGFLRDFKDPKFPIGTYMMDAWDGIQNISLVALISASSSTFGFLNMGLQWFPPRYVRSQRMATWFVLNDHGLMKSGMEYRQDRLRSLQMGLERFYGDRHDKWIDLQRSQRMLPLYDASYVDNTGIAQAVSSGATEVTVFISAGKDFGQRGFFALFQMPDNKRVLFPYPIIYSTEFPICKEAKSDVHTYFGNYFEYFTVHSIWEHLKGFAHGTVYCTTALNEWFGIRDNVLVKMNVVYLRSSMPVSKTSVERGRPYGNLLQEIIEATTTEKNVHKSTRLVQKFFM